MHPKDPFQPHPPISPPPPPPRPAPLPPARSRPRRRSFGAKLLRALLVLMGVAFFGLGLLFVLGLFFWGTTPGIEDGTWVELRFSPNYPEMRPDRTGLRGALSPTDLSAQDVLFALDRIETDPRIEGILLRADGFGGGWAQARELHARLKELQESGTRVVAYVEDASSAATYLAAAARSIVISPEGMMRPVGMEARLTFLRGSLDKLGASADFVAIGEYKSAPEQLQSETASEASRQQVAAYLDDIFGLWVESIAEGRGMTPERVRMLVDRGIFDAEEALAEGLADVSVDRGELWSTVVPGQDEPMVVDLLEYLAWSSPPESFGPSVALVYVDGTILSGPSGGGGLNGSVAGSDTIVERLRRASDDDGIGAIVLRVNSPGGSALASDLIHREIQRARAVKPVVISMGDLAASGGYYVSMAADRVIADPLTLTGSIGVYTGKIELSGLYDKLGLGFETFQRGESADLFSDLARFRPEQRQRIRSQLERFYSRFVSRVAEGRNLAFESVDEVARGRVWSGKRALEHGLVDEMGTLHDALRAARDMAAQDQLRGPVRVVNYQPQPGFFEAVVQGMFSSPEASAWSRSTSFDLPPKAAEALGLWASALQTLDGSVQYHLAWSIDIR